MWLCSCLQEGQHVAMQLSALRPVYSNLHPTMLRHLDMREGPTHSRTAELTCSIVAGHLDHGDDDNVRAPCFHCWFGLDVPDGIGPDGPGSLSLCQSRVPVGSATVLL
jgi:hypothetical protein